MFSKLAASFFFLQTMLFYFHFGSEAAYDKNCTYRIQICELTLCRNMHGQGFLTTLFSEGTDAFGLSNQISQSDEQIAAHENVLPSERPNSST